MKKWLFNPFQFIAGAKALLIGLAIMSVTAIIAFYTHAHFDGVLDAHFGAVLSLSYSFLEQLIDWSLPTVIFYLLALMLSSSSGIRFIDVAGTLALARWPMLFVAVAGTLIPHMPIDHNHIDVAKIMASFTPVVIVATIFVTLFAIWMIALTYNAFAVSCNLKGSKAILGFIAGLLVSEILSKIIFHYLLA